MLEVFLISWAPWFILVLCVLILFLWGSYSKYDPYNETEKRHK